jgi:hypothetical protein
MLLVAAVLAGCIGGAVQLRGALEEPPLVDKLDVTVGSHFPGRSRGTVVPTPVVRIPFGEASADRFRQAWDAMFAQVVDLPDWPPWRSRPPPVDGVIEVADAEMVATVGDDLDKPDRVRVRYRICLYEPSDTLVKCWSTDAESHYQRGIGECLSELGACLGQQADHVMREAIARFLLEFEADPDAKRWARRKARR